MTPYERVTSDMEKAEVARIKAVIEYNIKIGVLKEPEDHNEICTPDSVNIICDMGVENEVMI